MLAIRQAVGPDIGLRADANRRWTLQQAVEFAEAASSADLEVLPELAFHLFKILLIDAVSSS